MRVHSPKLICITRVKNFQTFKLVFCMYNKPRLHSAISFSKRAHLVENLTIYRADDLCVTLVCKYFCWMLGDPTFFRQITSFSDSFHCTKTKQKNMCVGSFNYFSYTVHIGSNLYMDTGVRDLEVAFV